MLCVAAGSKGVLSHEQIRDVRTRWVHDRTMGSVRNWRDVRQVKRIAAASAYVPRQAGRRAADAGGSDLAPLHNRGGHQRNRMANRHQCPSPRSNRTLPGVQLQPHGPCRCPPLPSMWHDQCAGVSTSRRPCDLTARSLTLRTPPASALHPCSDQDGQTARAGSPALPSSRSAHPCWRRTDQAVHRT